MDTNKDTYGLESNSFNGNYGQVTESQSIPVYADVQTYPCSICGRCFNAESLRKHQNICKKAVQKQPRKVFDTGKQRATDSDVPYKATRETTQFYQEGVKPKPNNPKAKPSNWREGHNELVRTIRQARQITKAEETGAPLPKQIPSQVPSDYIQCEYCQRHFNKYTAERHIPFCETQFKRKQMHYAATNNIRTPPGNNGRQGRANHFEHQINSAPSKLVSKRPQKTNDEKDYQRSPQNTNGYKRPTFTETIRNPINDTPSKYGSHPMIKTRNAKGSYLRGMMRTGRTTENDRLNVMADGGREQQRYDASSQIQQQRTADSKARAPDPASQMNNAFEQQKTRIPSMAKHCHECGEAFPVERAKFCCECGEKRFGME